jgi:hypothetical protein
VKATTATSAHHVDPLVLSLLRDTGSVVVLGVAAMLIEGLHPIRKGDVLASNVGIFFNQVSFSFPLLPFPNHNHNYE